MRGNVFNSIAVIGITALGLAVGALAFYNHQHRTSSAKAAVSTADSIADAALAKPRLTVRRASMHSTQSRPEHTPHSGNFLERLRNGEAIPKLTLEQANAYLSANRRSAGSLLGAFQATGDRSFLQEAIRTQGDNPAVEFTALSKSNSPEERRQWLEALKRSAPDNALAAYLSANEYFKASQPDEALKALQAAQAKPNLEDYALERIQNVEEAYRSAGYSEAEAKAIATSTLELPQLAQFKQLTQNVTDLAASYRQAGDSASAQAALQMTSNLGQRLATGQATLIQDLVGLAVEKLSLSGLDPAAPYGPDGQTVKERMDQLTQQRQAIRAANLSSAGLLENLPEQDLVVYFDRLKMFGEYQTMQWLTAKYGKQ